MLERLAETVSDEVRMRRIESDRVKPRAAARYVTIIVIITTVGLALMGDYVGGYGTGQGQLLLIAWLGLYLGCLLWMKQITTARPMPDSLALRRRHQAGGEARS